MSGSSSSQIKNITIKTGKIIELVAIPGWVSKHVLVVQKGVLDVVLLLHQLLLGHVLQLQGSTGHLTLHLQPLSHVCHGVAHRLQVPAVGLAVVVVVHVVAGLPAVADGPFKVSRV